MRTTLTLDDDIARKLKSRARKSTKSFKETVNEVLRLGLNTEVELIEQKPFRVQACDLGCAEDVDYDNIAELLERIEGPASR